MINIMNQGGKAAYKVEEYVADTESDVVNLPTDPADVAAGSTCFVIETSNVYMLTSDMEWKLI